MTIIQRYIGKTVLSSMAMVFLVFVGLQIFIMFITELSDIGSGDYGITQAFIYVMKLTPSQVYRLFPVSSLLGTLIGLGLLASHNELTVLRASGVSIMNIVACVMRAAILVMMMAVLIGEGLGPFMQYQANAQKELLTTGGQALATQSGVWVRVGDHYILIDQVVGHRHLRDVTVYRVTKDNQFSSILTAKRIDYEKNHWVMRDIHESLLSLKGVTTRTIKQKIWDVNLSPDLLNVGFDDPSAMNLVTLWHYIQYRKDNGLQVSDYKLAFWKRLYQPLAILVMIFLAIPFVLLGSLRSMTMGLRIILGIMMGLGFFIFNELLGQFSIVFQVPAPIAALLPILLFAGAAVLLVKKRV